MLPIAPTLFAGAGMTISLDIDDSLTDRIARLAQRQRRSARGLMLEAIADYVSREETRAAFADEAVQSWSAYEADGLHLTGREVDQWLENWGAEKEQALPPCHE